MITESLADKKHGKAVFYMTSRKFSSAFGSFAIGKGKSYHRDTMKCPGQDTRHWKKEDIFEVRCPVCFTSVEFFKDDVRRRCKKCINPKLDLGCLEWCDYAEECVGNGYMKKKKKKK
jgi:hypothetical protein